MNKAVIIHGYTSHCDAEWFPWLKTRLERDGLMPYIPEMPDSDHPVLQDWLNQLEREIPVFDEDTLLIGHSLGCITLLRYLQRKKTKIGGLILVSGFIGRNPMRAQSRELSAFTDAPLDLPLIERLAPRRMTITARNDDIVPSACTVEMAEQLRTDLIVLNEGGHFIARDGYTRFPVLYQVIQYWRQA